MVEDVKVEIPPLPECYTVFVYGPVSSGKTWLMREWAKRKERILVQDPAYQFKAPEFEEFWSNEIALCSRLESNPHYYRLSHHSTKASLVNDFEWNYRAIWTLPKPRWFFIDEVHEVAANSSMHPDMENICRYSRHVQLGVVGSSQRHADVDRLLTADSRMYVIFHTTERIDLDNIFRQYGKEVRETVEQLRPCIYNDATKECLQHPQCLVIIKGRGHKVFNLGSKIATRIQGETELWQEISAEAQPEQAPLSSPPDSGNPEPRLSEDISETM